MRKKRRIWKQVKKTKNPSAQLPNISRKITERCVFFLKKHLLAKTLQKEQRTFLFIIAPVVIAPLIGLVLFQWVRLQEDITKQQQILTRELAIEEEISKLTNILRIHPGYRDAYFARAVFEYQLGQMNAAWEDVGKTLVIDPMFQKGKDFQKFLFSQ